MKKKISVIFGTRPETIKLCPVVLALKADPAFDCRVCVTGQHREMLQQVLGVFDVANLASHHFANFKKIQFWGRA